MSSPPNVEDSQVEEQASPPVNTSFYGLQQGTKRKYVLNLDSTFDFPNWESIPVLPRKPKEKWWMIYEILIVDQSSSHVRLWCQDKLPQFQCSVTITGPSLLTPEWREQYKVGWIVCLKNMALADTYGGYKVIDPSRIMILPCGLKRLRELNTRLYLRSMGGKLRGTCYVCDKASSSSCGDGCKTQYCSKECQRADWREHKKDCKVIKTLQKWNRTDWG